MSRMNFIIHDCKREIILQKIINILLGVRRLPSGFIARLFFILEENSFLIELNSFVVDEILVFDNFQAGFNDEVRDT